jgi:hypothetical protein
MAAPRSSLQRFILLWRAPRLARRPLFVKELARVHLETAFMGVILRSKATKNLIVTGAAEILRFAQNDMEEFPDEH